MLLWMGVDIVCWAPEIYKTEFDVVSFDIHHDIIGFNIIVAYSCAVKPLENIDHLIPNFKLSFSAILVVGWFIISNMLRVNFCKTMKNDPASTLSNLALDSSRIPWSCRVAKPFNWSYYSLIWIYNSLSFSGSFLSTFITYWLAFDSQLVAL